MSTFHGANKNRACSTGYRPAIALASVSAAVARSVIETPFELVKTRMQLGGHVSSSWARSGLQACICEGTTRPHDCARKACVAIFCSLHSTPAMYAQKFPQKQLLPPPPFPPLIFLTGASNSTRLRLCLASASSRDPRVLQGLFCHPLSECAVTRHHVQRARPVHPRCP